MSNYDLSILIPALREEFLANTVEDIIKKKRGNTEVIVGLDGEWASPGVIDHPDVRVVYSSKNLGQRGMTNYICRLSKAKYVAKTDAHCAFDEGFDVKLMEAMKGHDNWTIVPALKNLHAFNWVCDNCGSEFYQGEKPAKCPDEMCQFPDTETGHIQTFSKKIYFVPRGEGISTKQRGPTSTAFRFTPDRLQFKYFGALKQFQDRQGEIAETMSLQGSFFMLTREKYWELNICDETWGGWGQQGTEVALKTWLSGGSVMCHRGTWYAHMFRTNNQIAFPWDSDKIQERQGQQQHRSREISIDLFKNNKWDKQVRGLSWVIERFWEPLQLEPCDSDKNDRKWNTDDLALLKTTEGRFTEEYVAERIPEKSIIYYTDNQLNLKIARTVQKQLRSIANDKGMLIYSASLKPMTFGDKNTVINEKRGYLAYFKQIVAALESSTSEYVFFCEHDVLYHPSHFDFTPPTKDKFYYNLNVWRLKYPEDFAVTWEAPQVAELCCSRELALDFYKKRLAEYEADPEHFDRKFEPGGRDSNLKETWWSAEPNIDIRHGDNLTKSKWSIDDFRDKTTCINWKEGKCPEWGKKLLSVGKD